MNPNKVNPIPGKNFFKPDQLAPEPETEKMVRELTNQLDAALASEFATTENLSASGVSLTVLEVDAVARGKRFTVQKYTLHETEVTYHVVALNPPEHIQHETDMQQLEWVLVPGGDQIYQVHKGVDRHGRSHGRGYELDRVDELYDFVVKLSDLQPVADIYTKGAS